MRKIYKALGLTVFLALPGVSVAQYCAGGPTSTADSNIESVDIAGENATAITYLGCPGVTGVEDQTAQSVELNADATYSLDVTFGSCGGNYGGAGQAWIDFNQDDVYDPLTESVGSSSGTPGTAPWNAAVTFNFTVPSAAVVGPTRMRVMQREGGVLPMDPCASYFWGSMVEFTVVILPEAPPVPVQDPTPPTCNLGSSLSLTGAPSAGLTWYWQTSPTGTDMANDGTNPWVVFANGTYYARAYDAVLDLWSSATSVTVSNFPLATAPPAPVAAANPACVPGTELTMPGTPGVDVTWYWQGTNSTGTSSATDAANPFTVTSSGTYYVAAFDASTSCWSDAVGTAVVVNSTIPDAPAAAQASYAYCGSAATMEIEAVPTEVGCSPSDIEVTISSAGWGDGTTWTLADNSGAVVLSGGTYANGYSDTQTLNGAANGPYTLTVTSTLGDNSPNYSVTVDGVLFESGNVPPFTSVEVGPLPCSEIVADVEWYSAATGGDFLGSGAILNALGTSVLPVAANGTYQFYAASLLDGCESATRTLIEVIITDVSVELNPVDETCINYADGSFTLGTVSCGTAPFLYSIDGGAFGAIPTDLSAGTYSVIVQDAMMLESSPITVVIGTTDTYIPAAPTANPDFYNICSNEVSQFIEAEADGSATVNYSFGTNIESYGPVLTIPLTVPALPAGATVTSAELLLTDVESINSSFRSEIRVGLSGMYTLGNTQISPLFSSGLITPDPTIALAGFPITGGTLNLLLSETFDDGGPGTIDAIFGDVVLSISYTLPATTINWYDASTAGTNLGSGSPFESVGTSVLASPASEGVYEFYAESVAGNCVSTSRTLVTVNVNNVNVTLDPIDADCNNAPTGSFMLGTVECGDAPFTFSVDGGAFGPIPTNLVPGEYSVVVMDDTGSESAEYTILIPDADAPSDLLIVEAFVDGADISWTAGALETDWNIEWGLPGFIPGTGDEIGSATVNTLNYVITGLNDNEFYDVYVSANCGAGSTPGDWVGNTFLTLCGPIEGMFFCEDFSSTSLTEACWTVLDVNGDGTPGNNTTSYSWNLNYTANPFAGDQVAAIYTDLNGGNNDDWLISPNLTLTGNEVLNFFYRVQSGFEPNDFHLLLSTTGRNPADFTDTLMFLASYDNTTYQDTTVDLTAYTGDVYIAWHVPSGGLDGWRLYIDQVCIDVCTPPAGIDGSVDACRLDELTNLNDIVVKGQEENGYWSFPSNEALIVDDTLFNVNLVPTGSYEVLWVVVGGCTNDTTVATITVFPPSSAGIDGTIEACRNQPINLFDGLNGNLDLGGVWYNPSNAPLAGAITTTSNIPGSFNFLYITSNGICPADTALVEVIVDGTCDHLSLGSEDFTEMTVFPNPATDVLNINVSSNTGAMKIEMTDINGRIVLADASALANSESATLSIAHLEKGVYTLRIFSIEGQRTFKIVKH